MTNPKLLLDLVVITLIILSAILAGVLLFAVDDWARARKGAPTEAGAPSTCSQVGGATQAEALAALRQEA